MTKLCASHLYVYMQEHGNIPLGDYRILKVDELGSTVKNIKKHKTEEQTQITCVHTYTSAVYMMSYKKMIKKNEKVRGKEKHRQNKMKRQKSFG